MPYYAPSYLLSEVQAVKVRIFFLEQVHHSQPVGIVVEPAVVFHQLRQSVLARVAERRVPEVVRQGYRLHQLLVEPESPRYGPRYLSHLDRVGKPRTVIIAFVVDEYLCLVFKPAESGGIDYPVLVPLVDRAVGVFLFIVLAPSRLGAFHGVGGEPVVFFLLELFSGAYFVVHRYFIKYINTKPSKPIVKIRDVSQFNLRAVFFFT